MHSDERLPHSLQPGDTLGPYEVEALIGQGGMGQVYRGKDTRLGRPVAIKVSAREFGDRFEREARAISSLNHPRICTLYDVGPSYLVMELVEGETLAHLIEQGPLPLDKALQYGAQIADALAAAHAKGVVHRDLKPGNVILTPNGVKVLDFGLAKLRASTADSRTTNVATTSDSVTGAGAILGTLHYMSPEQVEAKEADERSDIFSFGAVLYEMITGRRAFDGDTAASVMASILRDQPTPLPQLRPQVPRTLDRIVRKCLEKRPDDRWQSARDLKPTIELIDLDAPASTSGSAIQAPVPLPKRRPWLWPALAAMAVLAVAGIAAWSFWPSAQPVARVTRFQTPLPQGVTINPTGFHVLVSPDGAKLAFTAAGEQAGLWVRDLESVEARRLPGTEGAVSPFWSPDSRSLAFGVGRRLLRVDVSGGPPQVLGESATNVGSGFWTEGGEIVFGGRGAGPMQRISAAGGVPVPVTVLAAGEAAHALPSLLPDGRHFLYLRTGTPETRGIYAGSLDAKPEEQPTKRVAAVLFGATFARSSNRAGGHLFFLRDGTLMAQPFDTSKMELAGEPVPVAQQIGTGASHGHFSVTPNGLLAYRTGPGAATQLTWMDRQGRDITTLGEPAFANALTLSPDESQVALFRSDTLSNDSGDLWLLDLARNIETRFTFGQSVSIDPGPTRPVWSPDGKQIAFFSNGKLYAKPSSGAGEPQLLRDVGHAAQPSDWSRDGRYLIYYDAEKGDASVLALPVSPSATGTSEPVTLLPRGNHAALSPDGRWLAYTSNESGQNEIYIQPFQAPGATALRAAAKWQVSRSGGTRPRWRADGRELFFVAPGGNLMAAGIEATDDALRPSAPVQLFQISLTIPSQWDVSRDGQRFLVAVPLDRGSNTPITVVMNWEAALKR